jgi:Kinesin-associated protein (KAP)
MCAQGLIPKCVEMMNSPRFQPVVLGLLYHVSMDDRFKSMFTYTDCVPQLYEMLMRVQVTLRLPPLALLIPVQVTLGLPLLPYSSRYR